MLSRNVITYIFMASVISHSISQARSYYVHPDSSLNRIQTALDACSAKDTVLVGPGTYTENIVWPEMQAVVLRSEKGPDSTIIDGAYQDCVIRFTSPSDIKDNSTVIEGFTICRGNYINGGGINCAVWHAPTIRDNIIRDNQAYVGAGIYSDGGIDERFGGPLVIENEIRNNNASYAGGGICCVYESSPIIRDNVITENSAQFGGGVCAYSYSHAHLINNTISNNNATNGGGIHCTWRSNMIIDSCSIFGNDYTGVYFESMDDGIPHLRFNDISNNVGYGVYSHACPQTIEALNNWWGDASGPYHPLSNPHGLGNAVSDYVDYSPWLSICTHCLGITEYEEEHDITADLNIHPNPFIHHADIRYQITDYGAISSEKCGSIKIYDVNGRLVKNFILSSVISSQSSVKWFGDDDAGRTLPAGIYLVRLEGEGYNENCKIVKVR